MLKVTLKLPSWIARVIASETTGWLTMEKQIKEGTTVNDILTEFVKIYPGFKESAFNPDTGTPTEQLNFVLNNNLMTYQEVLKKKLSDGDTVMLVPIYFGG